MPAIPVDTLIDARWIIPVIPAGTVFDHYSLVIQDGKILDVLPQHAAHQRYQAQQHVVLAEHALIPGLINAHTHAAMSLFRGVADDLPLNRWLTEAIWPLEAEFVNAEFVYDGTLLAACEMLLGGTTCCNDMYFFGTSAARAFDNAGIRAVIGGVILEFPTGYAADANDYLGKALELHEAIQDKPLLSFALAPHAPYTVSDETFRRVYELAQELECPIHIHVHETAHEVSESLQQHQQRPLQRLAELGICSPDMQAVHSVHLDENDQHILKQHNASVVHCPTSNLKLASGIAPIADLLAQGITVALGTDGSASNNRLDMFQEMRMAALLGKVASGDASAVSARQALEMATLNGARALGKESQLGSLTVGKAADMCAVNMQNLVHSPVYDPISHLVYVCNREQVSHVWVNGVLQVENHSLLRISDTKLIPRVALWQNRIGTYVNQTH